MRCGSRHRSVATGPQHPPTAHHSLPWTHPLASAPRPRPPARRACARSSTIRKTHSFYTLLRSDASGHAARLAHQRPPLAPTHPICRAPSPSHRTKRESRSGPAHAQATPRLPASHRFVPLRSPKTTYPDLATLHALRGPSTRTKRRRGGGWSPPGLLGVAVWKYSVEAGDWRR